MIRFQPDTLGQALTRFFDMAAPDGNVYIEIAAPDFRFGAIVLLAAVALLLWRRLGPGRRPAFALLAALFVSAAIWLATTGNGRYFMAMLVVAGPVAIALVCLLPITRAFKAALGLLLVAAQAFALWQQPPWNNWTVMHWTQAPYFEVELGPEEKAAGPVTYASLSVLSYSLIAPQFPPQAHWTNLYTTPVTPDDARREEEFMRNALAQGPVHAIAPAIPEATLPDGRPNADIVKAFNKLIARRNLRISGDCHFINAPGLVKMARRAYELSAESPLKLGFWSCPLAYQAGIADAAAANVPPAKVQDVLAKLGELCPRFFPPGEKAALRIADGWLRHYSSETKVYVLDNGEVWYRYWRSLNPVLVGKSSELLAGEVRLDCLGVRGDGPWKTGAQ